LFCFYEKIDEIIRFAAEIADTEPLGSDVGCKRMPLALENS
jgi:hypothetical protein